MKVPFLAIFSSNIYDEDMKQEITKEKALSSLLSNIT